MRTAQEVIKQIGSHVHRLLLKEHGFRKTGLSWNQTTEWTRVVGLQKSTRNTSETGQFTVNLGIYVPRLHEAAWLMPPAGKIVREYDCTVRRRLGRLLPTARDTWWSVRADTLPEKAATSLVAELREYGLPWLLRPASLEDLVPELGSGLVAGVARHLVGDHAGAVEELKRELVTSTNPAYLTRVRNIATNLGIAVPD